MASSYQDISELYVEAGHLITGDPLAWEGFLASACRNYKCRFDEQVIAWVTDKQSKTDTGKLTQEK